MENHYKRAHPQIPVPRKHINTKEIIGNAQQELYEFQKNKKPKKQNGGAKRKQPQKKRKRKMKIKQENSLEVPPPMFGIDEMIKEIPPLMPPLEPGTPAPKRMKPESSELSTLLDIQIPKLKPKPKPAPQKRKAKRQREIKMPEPKKKKRKPNLIPVPTKRQ